VGASVGIQEAIYALLRGDATLIGLLAADLYEGSPSGPAVYDHVLQADESEDSANFPYVVIGDDTAAEFDTDDVDGEETTIVLHIWDRRRGRRRVKQIRDAIYNLVHGTQLDVSGQSTVLCYFEFSESIPDHDPLTQHGVIRFRIVTQES